MKKLISYILIAVLLAPVEIHAQEMGRVVPATQPQAQAPAQGEISDEAERTGLDDACLARRSEFVSQESSDGSGPRIWNLPRLRTAAQGGDQCAQQLMPHAANEAAEYWTNLGRQNNCINSENLLERGEGCDEATFNRVQQNLFYIDSLESGVEVAAPTDEVQPVEGTSCTTGDCDRSAVQAASPVDAPQQTSLAEVNEVLNTALEPSHHVCDQFAPAGDPRRRTDNEPGLLSTLANGALPCVVTAVRAFFSDIGNAIRGIWNGLVSLVTQRQEAFAGLSDIAREFWADPGGFAMKVLRALYYHYLDSEHVFIDGSLCATNAVLMQGICQSAGRIATFFAGGLFAKAAKFLRGKGRNIDPATGAPRPNAAPGAGAGASGVRNAGNAGTVAGIRAATRIERSAGQSRLSQAVLWIRNRRAQPVNYRLRYQGANGRELARADLLNHRTQITNLETHISELRGVRGRTWAQRRELQQSNRLLTRLRADEQRMVTALNKARYFRNSAPLGAPGVTPSASGAGSAGAGASRASTETVTNVVTTETQRRSWGQRLADRRQRKAQEREVRRARDAQRRAESQLQRERSRANSSSTGGSSSNASSSSRSNSRSSSQPSSNSSSANASRANEPSQTQTQTRTQPQPQQPAAPQPAANPPAPDVAPPAPMGPPASAATALEDAASIPVTRVNPGQPYTITPTNPGARVVRPETGVQPRFGPRPVTLEVRGDNITYSPNGSLPTRQAPRAGERMNNPPAGQ